MFLRLHVVRPRDAGMGGDAEHVRDEVPRRQRSPPARRSRSLGIVREGRRSAAQVLPSGDAVASLRRRTCRGHRARRPPGRRPRARSSADGCATGCSATPSKDIDLEVFGVAGRAAPRPARAVRPRRHHRRELHGLQVGRHRRRAAAPRVEGRARPPRLRRRGRPGHVVRRGGPAPRLHHQRDRLGSAHRRVPRSARRARRSRRARAARGGPGHVRRRQPARAARDAVRGPLRADADARHARDLPAHRARRPARRSACGERFEKLLLLPARPSLGFQFARDAGVVERLFPEMQALDRLRAGTRVASRGRRVGAHADGDRRGPRPHRRPAAMGEDRGHAGRRLPRLRQAGDHGVLRRPHPVAQSRGGGRARRRARCSIG